MNDLDGADNGAGTFPFLITTPNAPTPLVRKGTILLTSYYLGATTPEQDKYILAHEMGHVFGLFHTFEHMICGTNCREDVAPNSGGRGINPYNTGDFIADTHPSPHPAYYLGTNFLEDCNALDNDIEDNCNPQDTFQNMASVQNNIMSYFSCKEIFTPEQTLRMHCVVDSYYPEYLSSTASLKELSETTRYTITPNPVSDCFRISQSGDKPALLELQLISLEGKEMNTFNVLENEDCCIPSDVPSGVYFLRISTSKQQDHQETQKIVVNR